jgi:hypothetical protein
MNYNIFCNISKETLFDFQIFLPLKKKGGAANARRIKNAAKKRRFKDLK